MSCLKVLSKEEHVSWWVVRALKTDSVGFVPASFLDRVAEEVTLGSASQVSVRRSNRTEARHLVLSGLMLYTEYSCVDGYVDLATCQRLLSSAVLVIL